MDLIVYASSSLTDRLVAVHVSACIAYAATLSDTVF